jgi:hypothetical protein
MIAIFPRKIAVRQIIISTKTRTYGTNRRLCKKNKNICEIVVRFRLKKTLTNEVRKKTKFRRSKFMATVSESLGNAIYSWCGLTPTQYNPDDALSTLWARSGHVLQYNSAGIQSLMACLYRRWIFAQCPMALNLTIGMFQGGIQTPRDLYNHLRNCPQPIIP